MRELRYAARFYQSDDGFFIADFPDLGGAGQVTQGLTMDEVREMAKDLVDGEISLRLEDNEDPMEPQNSLPDGDGWEWVYPSSKVSLCWQIRRARRERGMTQKQVAALLGVAQETYFRWENPDKFNAKLETLEKLARVFGGRLQVSLVA